MPFGKLAATLELHEEVGLGPLGLELVMHEGRKT